MCWKCGNEIQVSSGQKIFFADECSFCHSPLHCCLNCQFYSSGAHYDCRETVEDAVSNKEDANFCDYFKPKTSFSLPKNSFQNKAEQAKKKFDELFSI